MDKEDGKNETPTIPFNFKREYIGGIHITYYLQYCFCNLIVFSDFILSKKGWDPAKYIFQYSLLCTIVSLITDLRHSFHLTPLVILAICFHIYYVLVIAFYYSAFTLFENKTIYPSIKTYKNLQAKPFETDEHNNVTYHFHPHVRYFFLFIAAIISAIRTYTFAFYGFHNTVSNWFAVFAIGLSYTEFSFQFIKGIYMFYLRKHSMYLFITNPYWENGFKGLNEWFEYIYTRWFINTYRPLEWFNMDVTTIGGIVTIVAELLYVIFMYALKRSHDIAWYAIITDAGITLLFFGIIYLIAFRYNAFLDKIKEHSINFNLQIKAESINANPATNSLITFGDGARWSESTERIGAAESLSVYIVNTTWTYVIDKLFYVIFFIAVYNQIQSSTSNINVTVSP